MRSAAVRNSDAIVLTAARTLLQVGPFARFGSFKTMAVFATNRLLVVEDPPVFRTVFLGGGALFAVLPVRVLCASA